MKLPADEVSLAHPLLTSCCVARFLRGRGPVLVSGPEVGDPCFKALVPTVRTHSIPQVCRGSGKVSKMSLALRPGS